MHRWGWYNIGVCGVGWRVVLLWVVLSVFWVGGLGFVFVDDVLFGGFCRLLFLLLVVVVDGNGLFWWMNLGFWVLVF